MLTPEQWEIVGKQAIKIYEKLELEIIRTIAERISSFTFAKSVVQNNIKIAREMGLLYQDIIILVAQYNNMSIEDIRNIFEEAGVLSLKFDDKIYKQAGLKPLPIKQNKTMWTLLEATAIKTNNDLSNMMMTTANTTQQYFYDAMNKAYMEVTTGVKSYSQAITDSIKEVSKKGATIQYKNREIKVESAVRMNIMTSVNQTCGVLQRMRAEEMGWDLMEITAHSGARPEHADWQGKIVSLSGKDGYLSLKDIGYGEVTGFKGVNCRHDWYPYFEGSTRTYSEKELEELKNEFVFYNGKKIPKYEATQIQRAMERQIRQDKKELASYQATLRNADADKELTIKTKSSIAKKTLQYKTHQNKLDDFIRQTSLKKDYSRLMSSQNVKFSQIKTINNLTQKFNNSNILGIAINNTKVKAIGEHFISQAYARNVSVENVIETLKKPIKFGIIRTDKSQQIKGENCTVVINTETGKLITTYPKKNKKE